MKQAQKLLNEQFDEMVATLQKTVGFNTEKGEPLPNAPFGTNVRQCLDYVLELARSFGLQTYDCDGYAGHADLAGTGKNVLGILGHLDVVPAKSEEWQYPPFGGEIHDGKLYGRGTMDDKGPMRNAMRRTLFLQDALPHGLLFAGRRFSCDKPRKRHLSI